MLTVLGGLAEFERDLIRARTSESRERARARGVKSAVALPIGRVFPKFVEGQYENDGPTSQSPSRCNGDRADTRLIGHAQ